MSKELYKIGSVVETLRDGRWVRAVVDDIAPNITGERAVYSLTIQEDGEPVVFYCVHEDRLRFHPPDDYDQLLTTWAEARKELTILRQLFRAAEAKLDAIGDRLSYGYDAELRGDSWVGGYDSDCAADIAKIMKGECITCGYPNGTHTPNCSGGVNED